MAKKTTYSAKNIEVLEGLEPVRKRPGMYIGSTNEQGLHHLVNEVLDNSIDEVVAGHANEVFFHYKQDGSIAIKDNGRGIPIDFHPKFKNKRALEIVLSTLHAGGKFDSSSYKTSGGLHGVGISVVNALSSYLEVNVFKNSKKYSQLYSMGKAKSKIKIEKCKKNEKGTEIIFIPDEKIFETTQFSPKKLYDFIKMKAVLVSGTSIDFKIDKELINDNTPNYEKFHFKNGIADFLDFKNKSTSKLFDKQFSINKNINDDEKCEIFISFNENEKSSLISFCNTIETPDGGSHENGFKNGVYKAIKLYGQKNQISKISNISINDLSDYSDIVISIFINEPSFEGQTKKRIIMPKLQKKLETIIQNEFLLWLNSNKKITKTLIELLLKDHY